MIVICRSEKKAEDAYRERLSGYLSNVDGGRIGNWEGKKTRKGCFFLFEGPKSSSLSLSLEF